MLEKGKIPVLGKIETIQLVKAYFQLLMRIFVNERMVGTIEKDGIIPKENYEPKKGCSIDDLMLEKRLMHDYGMKNWNQ